MTNETQWPVAIFGAGSTAISLYKRLRAQYNVVCFCDSDERKWGTQLLGLPVLSFEQALEAHPDLHVYVATNDDYKFEIMEKLISSGFARERIVNYESYRKYTSCRCLETRIGFSEKMILICPSSFGRHQSPRIPYTQDPAKNIKNFLAARDEIIDCVSTGRPVTEGDKAYTCIGCPELKERYWAVNRRINDICFSIKHKCNFSCCYCVENKVDKSALTGNENLDAVLGTMQLMSERGIIDTLAIVAVAPTEITIHPYRDKILDFTQQYVCQFTTNASVYVEQIAASLQNSGKMFTSLDAGTRETFRRVKGVDRFERVCDNLKRYAESGEVEMKYIFLPGMNDNPADVDGFLAVGREIQPIAIHISRNTDDFGTTLPEHTLRMIARMVRKAGEIPIQVNISPLIFSQEEYQTIREYSTEE